MMSPTWILDVFAALMLVVAAVSGTRLAAARRPAGADHDVTHLPWPAAIARSSCCSARRWCTCSPRPRPPAARP